LRVREEAGRRPARLARVACDVEPVVGPADALHAASPRHVASLVPHSIRMRVLHACRTKPQRGTPGAQCDPTKWPGFLQVSSPGPWPPACKLRGFLFGVPAGLGHTAPANVP